MNWYLGVLKKYAVFSGRARRKEYWYFVLFNIIISIAVSIIGSILGTTLLDKLYALAILLPGLAVSVRRLHDIDRSGWWLLLIFIPIAGPIILLVFAVTNGTQGANQYGPDPKEQVE